MATDTDIEFKGSKQEQELAARAFEVMRRKGILFSATAPIRMSVEAIAAALTKEGGPMAGADPKELAPKIEAALSKNKEVFARGEGGEFITTKAGRAYRPEQGDEVHTFKQRLNPQATTLDPTAAREYATSLMNRVTGRAEKSAITDTIVEIPAPVTIRPAVTHPRAVEVPTVLPPHLIPEGPSVEGQVTHPAPQRAQEAATTVPAPGPTPTAPARRLEEEVPPVPARTEVPQAQVAEAATPATTEVPVAPVAEQPAATVAPPPTPETPVEVPAAPVTPAKPAPPTQPRAQVVTGPVEVRVPTEDGYVTFDLNRPVDEIMADQRVADALIRMLENAVEADSRLIRFGSEIFPEDSLERFSKGDFRRIKEYLEEPETGGVASDRDIMNDVLGRRTDHPDYERLRFSLNYRLLKEKKDFEFVGIDSDRLWIVAGASPVPPPPRKPNEIGQDYRYLEDPAITSVEEEAAPEDEAIGPIEYSLTYYEYENGVLPYDRRFKRIFPGQVFEDQRISLLRFEIPQLYGALLAELRYPTGNRGGFIMGLTDLFAGHMVPGAKFTILPTDRGEDVFEIRFNRIEEREDNLLQYDERRDRYVFRPVSYSVDVDPAMLLTQDKFGKLQGRRKLDESERKRPDVIIANAFEVVGEESDGKLWAVFDDLFPVVNIERPFSPSWLKTLLSGAYPFFYPDETTEGAYFYDPSRRP
jgi:hypothetical protein